MQNYEILDGKLNSEGKEEKNREIPQEKVKTSRKGKISNHGIIPTAGAALVDLHAVDSANFMCINLLE